MTTARISSCRGGAAVELLLCLPLLLLLAFPVADLARLFQADMILTNMAREGASLAARTVGQEQVIMDSLAATAPPLDMRSHGMIRITKILAIKQHGETRNVVIAQQRWGGGSYVPKKGVWTCGAAGTYWDRLGNCAGLPSPSAAPSVDLMQGMLADGDLIHVVETSYGFPLLFSGFDFGGIGMPDFNPDLYAITVF